MRGYAVNFGAEMIRLWLAGQIDLAEWRQRRETLREVRIIRIREWQNKRNSA